MAWILAHREIFGTVNREGEGIEVAPQDLGGSVSLMHIAVDDTGASNAAFREEGAKGDGCVIEDAVTFTRCSHGVMGTSCEIDRNPIAS
jgi:hypothetical protein